MMRVNVKILQGADCSPNISEDASVHELKCALAAECNIPVERQRLVFKGKPMQDGMSLLHYGVTQDSRIFLSVKDAETTADRSQGASDSASYVPPTSSAAGASSEASSSSTQLDLQKELRTLLLRHFTPADAERVAEEFNKDLKNLVSSLSLDDIEHLAKANLTKTNSS